MDGDYRLPTGIAEQVQQRGSACFAGKHPFDIDLHNADFFQKVTRP